MISEQYDPKAIEGKWQQVWEARRAFRAIDPHLDQSGRSKYYCLCMFPYPSGQIHMGHVRNYSIGDIISRYRKMCGFNVLQPYGWDAFGMPAENAAIERGVHPEDWTLSNIAQMRECLKSIGLAVDWDREIATCLPEYFRWEQLLFRRFYESGLAYKKTGLNNWCEQCQTVLANEQVHDGKCWRCGYPVEKKELNQWYLKITDYADQLLDDHKLLEGKWPDRVLEMQKNWIGRSEGCRIIFPIENRSEKLEVFTTRADTLFGATFVTLAAAHPLAQSFCKEDGSLKQLEQLKREVEQRSLDEVATSKNGFFTGSYCVHPLTGERVPIWVGDFVVMEYGTGAVMAVPAHDQRDFEFATAHEIPSKRVIVPEGLPQGPMTMTQAFVEHGRLTASAEFTNQTSSEGMGNIADALEAKELGGKTIQYRLRDWGISRQRYWGAPIPIINCDDCGIVLVPEEDLPVELPKDIDFKNVKGNPLNSHPTFKKAKCPKCGKPGLRETNTMDTFVESSWYYARYTSPKYDKGPFDKKAADSWLPVDFYIGGIEHACMHLLYARFFHKVLRDWGYLSGDEPFTRLLTQGMVIKDGAKMSKSKGNVVSPDDIIKRFGVDTARLFCLFAAPPEKDLDWNDKGVEGCHRFLQRVWRLCFQFKNELLEAEPEALEGNIDPKLFAIRRKTHWMIKKVTENIETHKFNTAISACMELVNDVYLLISVKSSAFSDPAGKAVIREAVKSLVLCLAPFAPHMCEEMWEYIGKNARKNSLVSEAQWPKYASQLLQEETFLLVIQINGKVRDKIHLPKNLSEKEIEEKVMNLPKVESFIEGKTLRKFVYVPQRLANVVVS